MSPTRDGAVSQGAQGEGGQAIRPSSPDQPGWASDARRESIEWREKRREDEMAREPNRRTPSGEAPVIRFCSYCGKGDDEHDWRECEREYARKEDERIQRDGPCGSHDYGLLVSCTCRPEVQP